MGAAASSNNKVKQSGLSEDFLHSIHQNKDCTLSRGQIKKLYTRFEELNVKDGNPNKNYLTSQDFDRVDEFKHNPLSSNIHRLFVKQAHKSSKAKGEKRAHHEQNNIYFEDFCVVMSKFNQNPDKSDESGFTKEMRSKSMKQVEGQTITSSENTSSAALISSAEQRKIEIQKARTRLLFDLYKSNIHSTIKEEGDANYINKDQDALVPSDYIHTLRSMLNTSTKGMELTTEQLTVVAEKLMSEIDDDGNQRIDYKEFEESLKATDLPSKMGIRFNE